MNQRAKNNIAYNLDRLRKCPQQYENIQWVLKYRGGRFNDFIRRLYRHIDKYIDCVPLHNRDVFWIAGNYLAGHTVKKVTNFHTAKGQQYLSYACCIDLFDKVLPEFMAPEDRPPWESFPDDNNYFVDDTEVIDEVTGEVLPNRSTYRWWQNHISMQMNKPLRANGLSTYGRYPVSMYILPKLTTERMDFINRQIGMLKDHAVYPNNCCADLLLSEGLDYDCNRVYFNKYGDSLNRKEELWSVLCRQIEKCIDAKGYVYKENLLTLFRTESGATKYMFDLLWKMFIIRGRSQYQFKAPTKEDRERFSLTSGKYILTRKPGHLITGDTQPLYTDR